MATDKRKHAFWLTDEVKTMVEIDFHLDNCGSQSEFVEKAIRFYDGYVHANKTGAYLPRALQEMLEGTLGVFGDRLGKLLFKLVVEHNMTNQLSVLRAKTVDFTGFFRFSRLG